MTTYAGATSVTFSSTFVSALGSLNVSLSPQYPASLHSGSASFPIPAGQVDLGSFQVEIVHAGGLNLKAGGTTVTLSGFVIDTTDKAPALTGLVSANGDIVGRLPLFNVSLSQAPKERSYGFVGTVQIKNAGLELTADAASVLNAAFSATTFSAGIPIGTASTNAYTFNQSICH